VDDAAELRAFFGMEGGDPAGANPGYPLLSPPAVVSPAGHFQLAQTADVGRYLGRRFGLWPTQASHGP
jgi:hypothetical protein